MLIHRLLITLSPTLAIDPRLGSYTLDRSLFAREKYTSKRIPAQILLRCCAVLYSPGAQETFAQVKVFKFSILYTPWDLYVRARTPPRTMAAKPHNFGAKMRDVALAVALAYHAASHKMRWYPFGIYVYTCIKSIPKVPSCLYTYVDIYSVRINTAGGYENLSKTWPTTPTRPLITFLRR